MSIDGKHAYRFEYLKSDQWKSVRIEALAREGGKCEVCGEESIFNDAHHIWYPPSVWETTEENLVILCRPCHEFLHALFPDSKTGDEGIGREVWIRFRNSVQNWQLHKKSGIELSPPVRTKELRQAYERVKSQLRDLQIKDQKSLISPGSTTEDQLKIVLALIKGWAKNSMSKEKSSCTKDI